MTGNATLPETFSLSAEGVASWLKERDSAERDIASLQNKVDELNRKLSAAYVLAPALFRSPPVLKESVTPVVTERPKSLLGRILEALEEMGEATPAEIRDRLASQGYDASAPNYFYTLLGRAVERGTLAKTGAKYRLNNGEQ